MVLPAMIIMTMTVNKALFGPKKVERKKDGKEKKN